MKEEFIITDSKGEMYKSMKRYTTNNYRKLHHMPLMKKRNKKHIKIFNIDFLGEII